METAMSEPARETVIIVHGTFAAPDPVKRRWYGPVDGRSGGEALTTKLAAALQERGSPALCWVHCNSNPILRRSGKNNWIALTAAASAFADYVVKLQREGWCCHIVAHSHGGNVVVEALPKIMTAHAPDNRPGKLVTL